MEFRVKKKKKTEDCMRVKNMKHEIILILILFLFFLGENLEREGRGGGEEDTWRGER